MKAFRKIGIFVALVAAVLAVSGCSVAKIKDLKVTSVGVKYLVPTSSRSMDAVLLLGLDNPSITFTVDDIRGVVKYYDREMVHFTAGELPCTAVLADKVSLLDLLAIAAKRSLDGMTADVKLHVKLRNGAGTTLTFNGLDLSSFNQ